MCFWFGVHTFSSRGKESSCNGKTNLSRDWERDRILSARALSQQYASCSFMKEMFRAAGRKQIFWRSRRSSYVIEIGDEPSMSAVWIKMAVHWSVWVQGKSSTDRLLFQIVATRAKPHIAACGDVDKRGPHLACIVAAMPDSKHHVLFLFSNVWT